MEQAPGRGRRLRQESKESRDSSVSSATREVRCGCQYFQTDSLLPERHSLVGTRPPSRNMGDHEYEVINPPPGQPAAPPPTPATVATPVVTVTGQEGDDEIEHAPEPDDLESESEPEPEPPAHPDFTPIINKKEHQYLRIPLDRDIVIPLDKAEVESLRYDDEEEEDEPKTREMTAQEIQDQIEERFFTATPTTTVSRTDAEFNTSQMDSSGLDELPLKKDARKGFNPKGFQQRIQSQAGRLRTRIRNIQRPKISLPDRPKLHLPDRPKFNLPDRPKFNIKRPDLKMPNFNFGKNKSSSIRRPLRDRSQIQSDQSTVGSKKKMFDSINFRTYPRIFSKKKKDTQGRRAMTPPPRMETESSPPSSPASRAEAAGGYGQRWSQRFKDIKFADDSQSDLKKPSFDDDVEDDSTAFRDADFKTALVLDKKQMKATSSSSIARSDGEQQSSGSSSERHRAGVIEEIDSDEFFLREKGLSREDVEVSRYLSMEIRDAFRSPKNALAAFDDDQYHDENERYGFEMHRPLGAEPIRQSMEAMRNQSVEQIRMTPDREIAYEIDEPVRPERTRSLKKGSTRSKSEDKDENQFKTYPPNRPSRMRKHSSQSKQSIPFDDYNEQEKTIDKRPPSVPSLAVTDTTKEISPSRYIDESSEALNEPWVDEPQPPLPPKRRKSTRDSSLDNESLEARRYDKDKWLDDEQAEAMVLDNDNALRRGQEESIILHNGYYDRPPALPMRKTRSQATSLADEDRTSRGADSLISETRTHLTEEIDVKPEPKAFIPENYGYAVVEKPMIQVTPVTSEKLGRTPPPSRKQKTAAQLANLKNQSINFFFTYPRRAIKKSLHKKSPPPIRPLRNYSSIGPSRPPRRNRVFREPVYEGEFIPLKDENDPPFDDKTKSEIIDDDKQELEVALEPEETPDEKLEQEVQESRDLQSGDVIEKMKGRPLPPPPRPPRKTRDDYMDSFDGEFDGEFRDDVQVTDLDDEEEVVVSERIDILVGQPYLKEEATRDKSPSVQETHHQPVDEVCERVKEPEVETTEPAEEPPIKVERRKKSLSVTRAAVPLISPVEVNISTQTDSLPEGYYLEEEQTAGTSEETVKATKREKKAEVEKRVETVVEHKVVVIPTPETEILKAKKIHVSELDVERLNVSEIQAKKITVSDIDGVSMQVTELTSKSGHLVVSGINLPASFLEAIAPPPPPPPIVLIQSATQTPPQTVDSQTNTVPQEVVPPPVIVQPAVEATPPPIPPPPTIVPSLPSPSLKRPSPPPSIIIQTPQGQRVDTPAYHHGHIPVSPPVPSPPPRSPTRTRPHTHESEEDLRLVPRRRRHHSKYSVSAQLSSDEEEAEFPSYPIARRAHQHEPSARELLRQLANIWQASMMRGVDRVVDGLNAAFPEGEKRKDAQTAACIVLVLIAGLLMLGFGSDKTVHHHHWDFMPPHP